MGGVWGHRSHEERVGGVQQVTDHMSALTRQSESSDQLLGRRLMSKKIT